MRGYEIETVTLTVTQSMEDCQLITNLLYLGTIRWENEVQPILMQLWDNVESTTLNSLVTSIGVTFGHFDCFLPF